MAAEANARGSRSGHSRELDRPGRRPLTSMCPIIFRDGDAPVLAAGASGGRRLGADVLAEAG